jgi:hypothetical protein
MDMSQPRSRSLAPDDGQLKGAQGEEGIYRNYRDNLRSSSRPCLTRSNSALKGAPEGDRYLI